MNRTRWYLCVAALGLAGASVAQTVSDVRVQPLGNGAEIRVVGKDLAKPKLIRMNGDKSLILEFDGSLSGKAGYQRVRKGGVQYLTYGWYTNKPPRVRVHVRLAKSGPTNIAETANGWALSVNVPISSISSRSSDLPAVAGFPDKVPPLVMASTAAAPAPVPGPVTAPTPTPEEGLQKRVTLDFVNTDIVQILKALAMQANVNIVTAPEVKGSLTVSLDNVTVTEALDLVTALGGMRYARSNNTFVVTNTEGFSQAMRRLGGNRDEANETRIVSITSGEGAQIKAAILKALPQDSVLGRYEILLPTEVVKVETIQQSSSGGNTSGGDKDKGNQSGDKSVSQVSSIAEVGSSVTARPKDFYVVLIGLSKRLDEIEKMVKQIDGRIADVSKVLVGKGLDTKVIPVYSGRIAEVASAVRKVVERDPKRELYTVQESNTGQVTSEEPVPLLMITGPTEAMEMVERFARGVDEGLANASGLDYPKTAADAERAYEVLDLRYVEPLEAAIELQNRVKGLRATMLPAPVAPSANGQRAVAQGTGAASSGSSSAQGNTSGSSASNQGSGRNERTGAVEDQGSSKSGTQGGAGSGQSSGGEANANQGDKVSLTKQLGSEPMKLLVRGTRSQIALAKQYLTMFDIPPRQVALELRVLELTREDAQKFGLDWSLISGGRVSTVRVNQGVGLTSGSAGSVSASQTFGGLTGSFDVLAALDALSTGVRLIARPNMIASEGRATNIFIGDEIRYVETVQTTQNGTTVTTGKVEVGVKFTVTPRVGGEGNLTLELSPELSLLKGFTPVPGGGQLPQTSVRSTNSVVNIKSGETLAIGGLIQDLDRRTVGGIPFLKDLPIIGALFKRQDISKTRSEVVFFLTAKTVNEADRKTAADPRNSERMQPAEIGKNTTGNKGG